MVPPFPGRRPSWRRSEVDLYIICLCSSIDVESSFRRGKDYFL